MAEKPIALRYDDTLVDYLTEKSFSQAYGARNLPRLIQKEIEDRIATEMILSFARPVKQVGVTAANGEIQILAV
jgi:ATP-dependent Clp protease ATP-binding subunit ClpA